MRRYSPRYYSPPRRGYGGRPRSPPRRGYGGERRRHKEQNHGSLLVRNIPLDCRPEELRVPFERFGLVRDVYLPKDYHTGQPRGFAFVQFVDPYDAAEAQYHMNGQIFAGREISVVVAAETRKRPEEMRRKSRPEEMRRKSRLRGPVGYGGQRSSYYGYSGSRSRSRSPGYPSGYRRYHRSRSYSPVAQQRSNYSVSPDRRHSDHPRSRDHLPDHDIVHKHLSYSPGYDDVDDRNGYNYGKKAELESGEAPARWRSSLGQVSRSPSGSRSRSADISPRHNR